MRPSNVEMDPNMMEFRITPQIIDTDSYGHVNFNAVSVWFDRARAPLYREYAPSLMPKDIGFVIRKMEIVYDKELHWNKDAMVRTWVHRIGERSFTVRQEAWQEDCCCAQGTVVFCPIDYEHRVSCLVPDSLRQFLERHLVLTEPD